ncbi:hypothetical protein, partial [Propionibacterium sp.]|uniref:hypothetical protein n=1 Tax=Propionibacterium sp. TaxID=1977903 RepID=UPI0039E8478E
SSRPEDSDPNYTLNREEPVIVHIGFWTTLVFFIVERSAKGQDVDFAHEWSVDDLPEPKDLGAGFSELVAYLVWLVIAAGALVWDHLLGFAPGHPGLSFFAVGLWPWWMGALFVVMAAGALVAIAVYVRGAWTPAAAWAKTVLNVVVMAGVLLLITRGELIDPAFFPALIPADSAATVSNIVIAVIGFAVVGSGVWDSIDGFLKVRRGRAARG